MQILDRESYFPFMHFYGSNATKNVSKLEHFWSVLASLGLILLEHEHGGMRTGEFSLLQVLEWVKDVLAKWDGLR